MKHFVSIFALLSLLCSCTKEIDIDYKNIEPIPVIEGLLSPEKAEVKITMTRNMNDSAKTPGMEAQWVKILLPDGSAVPLSFESDGYYRSASPITLQEGNTYTLQVSLDDVVYTGSSTSICLGQHHGLDADPGVRERQCARRGQGLWLGPHLPQWRNLLLRCWQDHWQLSF